MSDTQVRGMELKRGRYYKLLREIDAIPSGVYRFEGARDGEYEFSVDASRMVRFIIDELDETSIAAVSYRGGRAAQVSADEFIDRIFSRLSVVSERD